MHPRGARGVGSSAQYCLPLPWPAGPGPSQPTLPLGTGMPEHTSPLSESKQGQRESLPVLLNTLREGWISLDWLPRRPYWGVFWTEEHLRTQQGSWLKTQWVYIYQLRLPSPNQAQRKSQQHLCCLWPLRDEALSLFLALRTQAPSPILRDMLDLEGLPDTSPLSPREHSHKHVPWLFLVSDTCYGQESTPTFTNQLPTTGGICCTEPRIALFLWKICWDLPPPTAPSPSTPLDIHHVSDCSQTRPTAKAKTKSPAGKAGTELYKAQSWAIIYSGVSM